MNGCSVTLVITQHLVLYSVISILASSFMNGCSATLIITQHIVLSSVINMSGSYRVIFILYFMLSKMNIIKGGLLEPVRLNSLEINLSKCYIYMQKYVGTRWSLVVIFALAGGSPLHIQSWSRMVA